MTRFIPPSERFNIRPAVPIQARNQASTAMRQAIHNVFLAKVVPECLDPRIRRSSHGNRYKTPPLITIWTDGYRKSLTNFPNGTFEYDSEALALHLSGPDFYDWIALVHHAIARETFHTDYGAVIDLAKIWAEECNELLIAHKSSWRFVGDELFPATSEEEIQALGQARADVEDPKLKECRTHYRSALQCFRSGDYPNTGKEAASALEALARMVTGKPEATLGKLTEQLASLAGLHHTHGKMISTLYGLTSDGGYRHGLKPGQDPAGEAEARFILVSVSAYINLLTVALREKGKL